MTKDHTPKTHDELTLTRMIDAPRDLVFRAWTDPAQLARWWGPSGFTTTMKSWEARAGGAILLEMNAPYGAVYPMSGAFREVVPTERIVFTASALDPQGRPIFEILNTVTFADKGGKTMLTLNARVLSKGPEADKYLGGQEEGWSQSLVRLGDLFTGTGR